MNNLKLLVLVPSEFEAEVLKDMNINLKVTGIGVVEAGISCFEIFSKIKDREKTLVLLVGWAGAYPETNLKEGDVVIASKEIWVDFGRKFESGYHPLPEKLGTINSIPFSEHVVKFLSEKLEGCRISPFIGALATVCATSYELKRSYFIRKTFGVLAENMEGFAVARVAQRLGVKFAEIRVISNLLEFPEKPWKIEETGKRLKEVVKCLNSVCQT